MKRDLSEKLSLWKDSETRKPLLLKGARQTGKTFLLDEFGRASYEKVHYINFEQTPEVGALFQRDLKPERILSQLATFLRSPIRAGSDLLIFDEVQACGEALASLKYFQEQAGQYHVAAAGSLLGVKMAKPGTFPVGKVDLLELLPMSFLEFLEGVGEARYRKLLSGIERIEPFAEPFHRDLVDLLRFYYLVGGMPEAVRKFAQSKDMAQVRAVQRGILAGYELDFAKHAPATDIPKLSHIWESIPTHLSRENKRFLFSIVKQGARAREYEDALRWLRDAGLVRLAYCAESVGVPLAAHLKRERFKAYALDTGLLSAMARIDPAMLPAGGDVFNAYRGAFAENYVAQQLDCVLDQELAYWKSESRKAEVDFLWQRGGGVLPLEVKAGVNPHSKSLRTFRERFAPPILLRSSLLNLRCDGGVLNVPLYAIGMIDRLAALALGGARGHNEANKAKEAGK